MKRALYFFPLNPADRNSGSISRAIGMLEYFKSRDIAVDFVSKHHWGNYNKERIQAFQNMGLAESIRVLRRKPIKTNLLKYFFGYKIQHLLFEQKLNKTKAAIPNHTTLHLRREFDKILCEKHYDYIVISYAYWADLIRENPLVTDSLTIMDTHDFLSAQHQGDPALDLGASIGEELRRLQLFDQIWSVSAEETYFFRQFFQDKVHFIPLMYDAPESASPEKLYDIVYVASDNPHNLRSATWFFDKVYPLLDSNIRIAVIGKINEHIPRGLSNIVYVPYSERLDSWYSQSKIAICPMLTGTGIKAKVIEAMAFGLPVVCTTGGVDGLPDKTNNGCLVTNIPAQFAASIASLLNDEQLYHEQSMHAKAYFNKNFEKNAVFRQIDQALNL